MSVVTESETSSSYPWENWNRMGSHEDQQDSSSVQHSWSVAQLQKVSNHIFDSEVSLETEEDGLLAHFSGDSKPTNDETSFFDLYYEYSEKIAKRHGERAICLVEEGSFYAMLGYSDDPKYGPSKTRERAEEVAALCGLQTWIQKKTTDFERWSEVPSDKEKVSRYRPIRAGFPTFASDKYIKKLEDEGYWIGFLHQEIVGHTKGGKKIIKRKVDKITHKSMDVEHADSSSKCEKTNMAIYVRQTGGSKLRAVGITIVNLESSTWEVFESVSTEKEPEKAVEDVERYVVRYKPTLVVWIGISEGNRIYAMPDGTEERFERLNQKLRHRSYQEQMLHAVMIHNFKNEYEEQNMQSMYMLDRFHLMDMVDGAIAYFHMLEFYFRTNKQILQLVSPPQINQDRATLILERNAVEELSLHALCDLFPTQTKMGKRMIQNRMFRPLTNVEEIEKLYGFNASCHSHLRQKLNVSDLHQIYRRLVGKHCKLDHLMRLHKDCRLINSIVHEELDWNLGEFLDELESHIDFDYLQREANPICYFLKSENAELLEIQNKLWDMCESLKLFEALVSEKTGDDENCGFKIEKGGRNKVKRVIFGGPKKHVDIVKKLFENGPRTLGKYVWNKESITITSNASRYAVSHFMISDDYPALLAELKELQADELKKFGKRLYEKWKIVLEKLAYNVGKLDAAIATLKMTEKHGLIKPTFVEGPRAFYQAENLRHPLIESTLTTELYVPNDFEGGTDRTTGMALYGVNSCGKSSGMRSIGTAVVMAQAGFGVAATSFHLCPFRNIMTRILGGNSKDQLRLSSFAIEVSEMKPIFYRADSRTLVLGDEIAHATEISSGTCIVATLLDHLVKQRIPFVIATHMRAIPELIADETDAKTSFSHFRVDIDPAGTKVVFTRKLQPGLGPQTYGISMAEHMGLPSAVCLRAREKLSQLEHQPESLIRNRCRYNHKKLMSPVCEYPGCTKSSKEHDHSYPQEISNHNPEFAHVTHHAANFQALCHEHHVLKTNAEKSLKRKLGPDGYRALSPVDYKRRMLEHDVVVK